MEQNINPDNGVIAVCLASDAAYVQHLAAAMASILKNKAPSDRIHFYILDGGIPAVEKERLASLKDIADFDISYVDIANWSKNVPELSLLDKKHLSKHISITSCYRLFIHELVPQVDRMIYLDCDLIVLQSLAEMYRKNMGKYLVLAVRDVASQMCGFRMGIPRQYKNSGVLLLDTRRMREQNMTARILQWIEKNIAQVQFGDQDILNGALGNDLGPLADKWNVQALRRKTRFSLQKQPAIVHFLGAHKPWKETGVSRPHAEEYFRYLEMTPYSKSYREPTLYALRRHLKSALLLSVSPFFSRTRSLRETYNTYRILGIRFRKKRDFSKFSRR
ncbi:MAG: glycosyltransferase family 8 protein [Burkholderiaceae bacterium]|jgi:lipopolysaccharide biosynthesis glycosyltransferase|nr:glycosyltransferase family 8 protein [Burkholderiaceae bacterium]